MTDLDFMQEALAEAQAAYAAGEFPVGAVIVRAGEIPRYETAPPGVRRT